MQKRSLIMLIRKTSDRYMAGAYLLTPSALYALAYCLACSTIFCLSFAYCGESCARTRPSIRDITSLWKRAVYRISLNRSSSINNTHQNGVDIKPISFIHLLDGPLHYRSTALIQDLLMNEYLI